MKTYKEYKDIVMNDEADEKQAAIMEKAWEKDICYVDGTIRQDLLKQCGKGLKAFIRNEKAKSREEGYNEGYQAGAMERI